MRPHPRIAADMTQTLHGRTNKRWRFSAARCGAHRPAGAGGGRPADRRPAAPRPRRLRCRGGPDVSRRQADGPARSGPACPARRTRPTAIHAAVRERRKIVVYGDYDADGMTGTAILLSCLQAARRGRFVLRPQPARRRLRPEPRRAADAGRARGLARRHASIAASPALPKRRWPASWAWS